jgi:hypothetical protein
MADITNQLQAAAGNIEEGGYQVSRSLRFNSADSAALSRTPSVAGNRRTFTWSGWVKRTVISDITLSLLEGNAGSTSLTALRISANAIGVQDYNGVSYNLIWFTPAVFRDPSAWYHIVLAYDTTQATSATAVKIYVNGVQQTVSFTTGGGSYSQNRQSFINATNSHFIGEYDASLGNTYSNFYLAEVNFVDGQVLTPSDFGEINSVTGVWSPKAYTGTYGTNGFYLNFSDNSNTTSTTLGKDYSGNNNNWTPSNFSVASGVGNDSMVDTPTSYGNDTGAGGQVRGNYCTVNPLANGGLTISNGNLDVVGAGNTHRLAYTTFGVSSGKWYFETLIKQTTSGAASCGVANSGSIALVSQLGATATAWSILAGGSSIVYKFHNNSATSVGSYSANSILGVAFDVDAGKLWFSINGTWIASGNPSSGTDPVYSNLSGTIYPMVGGYSTTDSMSINFGQQPFAYTAPSGFKALCTQNLPTPTVVQGDDYFNTVLYTGNGSTQSITGVGFQPDWVWIKERNAAADHGLYDAVRGVQKQLESNTTTAETTESTGLTAFGSDGFTVGSLAQLNTNTDTYVAWNWNAGGSNATNTSGSITSTVRANPTSGFSIVTYTGNGSTGQVDSAGHGLGVTPKLYIIKQRSATNDWYVFTNVTSGGWNYGLLNTTQAFASTSQYADSTKIYLSGTSTNASGGTYVAYCFAEIEGFSKFGSYTGNGSADGPFVYCGFRPRWVLFKQTNTTNNWVIIDTVRNTFNVVNRTLYPDLTVAEESPASGVTGVDVVSNGFKIRDNKGFWNTSSGTYIFAAFAENPFKYSLAR